MHFYFSLLVNQLKTLSQLYDIIHTISITNNLFQCMEIYVRLQFITLDISVPYIIDMRQDEVCRHLLVFTLKLTLQFAIAMFIK